MCYGMESVKMTKIIESLSGLQWENDTSACWDNYDICVN